MLFNGKEIDNGKVQLVFENLKANDLYKTLKPEDIVLKETEFELTFQNWIGKKIFSILQGLNVI